MREWLRRLALYERTTHVDRVEIDKEIERRTGVNCDEALARGLISEEEFRKIVLEILKRRKKRKKEAEVMIV